MFKMQDLYIAYRKAKVDLFYSSNPPLIKLALYEDRLEKNLENLLEKINEEDLDWVKEEGFIGGWTLAPKSIKLKKNSSHLKTGSGLIYSSPEKNVTSINKKKDQVAEFRLMAQCSIDFHILSTLWMLKVGACFDKKLSENSYGSRLRRDKLGKVENNLIGSFKPYFKPYRDWQDNGFEIMHSALDDDTNSEIITLTADVSSFYHELNPDFMLNEAFLAPLQLQEYSENKLHKLFISALIAWAKNTPLKKGLPVGLPASAVIANMALNELDRVIEQNVVPLYYGRYVDDILMVIKGTPDITSAEDFWKKLFKSSEETLDWKVSSSDYNAVQFKPTYLILPKGEVGRGEGSILFENEKNKIFVLSGKSGKDLLNSIQYEIYQRSSEWRSLPNLPHTPEYIASDLLNIAGHKGEYVDNLRKMDFITLDRAGFALKLRGFEVYERDLPASDWREHRYAFFDAILKYFFMPNNFFELERYFSRIIKMATACEDFDYLGKFIEQACKLVKIIKKFKIQIKAKKLSRKNRSVRNKSFKTWKLEFYRIVFESIISAIPHKVSFHSQIKWQKNVSSRLQEILGNNLNEAFVDYSSNLTNLKKNRSGYFLKT